MPARPRSYQRLRAEAGPEELVLEIPGNPVSKERPRTGKGGHFYTPRKTRDAEDVVKWHARAAGAKCDRHSLFSVDFVFFCQGNRLRDNDNMQKLVQDALNKVVWWDDSQIRHSSVDVIYGSPQPRSVITIRRLP
ncbi:MAG: RusA family crossover junction endodeoxyribonuclease [Actinomycetes bacterium]